MANNALFYNSIDGDRTYDAEDFTTWLKPFFVSGVFYDDLQVTSSGGMGVTVDTGYVNIEGKVKFFDEVTNLTLDRAHSTLDRIDNIIVRRNDTDRDITIMVQKGTNSENPIPPTPVRENNIYDLVLCQVLISAASTSISQSNITDTRMDSELCGWVAATVKEIDFEQISLQWQSFIQQFKRENEDSFTNWYDGIKEAFAEDVPGTLQAEIDDLDANKANLLHTHLMADITDLDVPVISDTYDGTSSDGMSGLAVKEALESLDSTVSGTGAGKTLSALSTVDGKVQASFQNILITKSQVSDFPTNMTPTSHAHGNIQNGGTLQSSDVAIANGDKLVVTDSSNSSKIARTSLSFDGSTTGQYLSKKGTWQSIPTVPAKYENLPKPNMNDLLYYKDGPENYRYPSSGNATQDLFISFSCYQPTINGTALDSDMLSGVMYLKRGQYFSCTVHPNGNYNKIRIYSVTF